MSTSIPSTNHIDLTASTTKCRADPVAWIWVLAGLATAYVRKGTVCRNADNKERQTVSGRIISSVKYADYGAIHSEHSLLPHWLVDEDKVTIISLSLHPTWMALYSLMIRLFVQDRNTSNKVVQYTRNTKKEKKTRPTQCPRSA